jgi:hypothetical protein
MLRNVSHRTLDKEVLDEDHFVTKSRHIGWVATHHPPKSLRHRFGRLDVRLYGDIGIVCEIVWLVASEHVYNMTNIGLNIHSDMLCDLAAKRRIEARVASAPSPEGGRGQGVKTPSAR